MGKKRKEGQAEEQRESERETGHWSPLAENETEEAEQTVQEPYRGLLR
jgi:hypothetical protein